VTMATLTPSQLDLLTSEPLRRALGEPTADEVAAAVTGAAPGEDGLIVVDLEPWREAVSAALREVGPDSVDSTTMEAADNLVKQLGRPPRS
jgi:hypothetical protein